MPVPYSRAACLSVWACVVCLPSATRPSAHGRCGPRDALRPLAARPLRKLRLAVADHQTHVPCCHRCPAAGIIVGTVPEGLLVTLTVALSLSARNMYAKNVLVKVRRGGVLLCMCCVLCAACYVLCADVRAPWLLAMRSVRPTGGTSRVAGRGVAGSPARQQRGGGTRVGCLPLRHTTPA